MKKIAKAKIKWFSSEQGGRTIPPSRGMYSTVVRFEDEPGSGDLWSLVVDLNTVSEGSMEITAPVWLLAHDKPDAPNHLLVPGSRFKLLEGRRVVAEGEVVDEIDSDL